MATEIERARRLFTVEEYDRMVMAGVFRPEDRLELIDGEIVEMSPIGPRHAACVNNLSRILVAGIGERAVVWAQNPVTVPPRSKPEPDVALVRSRSYLQAHPGVEDVLLFLEVAETSRAYDRRVKLGVYARAGIPEYGIVDTSSETIEAFSAPGRAGYRDTRRIARDELVAPAAFPDVRISAAELFV